MNGENKEPTLDELLEKARAWYDDLTEEEKAAHRRAQAESWARAEMAFGDEGTRAIPAPARPSPAPAEGMGDWVRVPREPTEAMRNAARDWSAKKYGKSIGDEASDGCWAAMLAAAPAPSTGGREEDKTREQVISAMADRLTAHECWAPKLDGGFAWTRAAAICTALYEMASPSPLSGEVVEALRGVVAAYAMNNAEPDELKEALLQPVLRASAALASLQGEAQ